MRAIEWRVDDRKGGSRVRYDRNLVNPHVALEGATAGDAAGVAFPDGFCWKAIFVALSPDK